MDETSRACGSKGWTHRSVRTTTRGTDSPMKKSLGTARSYLSSRLHTDS